MIVTDHAARAVDDPPPDIPGSMRSAVSEPASNLAPNLDIDISIEECWEAMPDAQAIVERAIAAAASLTPDAAIEREVAVLLTDDASVKTLNRDFRHIDKPTNVLSFPAPNVPSLQGGLQGGLQGMPRALGDIAIAFETTRAEAIAEGKPLAHHLSHLAIHGFLHLIGHDHDNDGDAETMEALERTILASLNIPDPYAPRDGEH